jgi:hypothetical protein
VTPATIYQDGHTQGTHWAGIPGIGPILIGSAPPVVPLVRVRMQLRKQNKLGFTLDSNGSGDAPITIVSAADWEAMIPGCDLPLPAGLWDFDIRYYGEGEAVGQVFHKGTLLVTLGPTRP